MMLHRMLSPGGHGLMDTRCRSWHPRVVVGEGRRIPAQPSCLCCLLSFTCHGRAEQPRMRL